MAQARYYHPDFRHDEVSSIVQALDRGQSVSVIGPPSVGKTNLLRFLDQERLAASDPNSPWNRFAPLAAKQGPLVAINIDPNALLPSLPQASGDIAARSWPGFELLVHRTTITPQLYPVYDPPPTQTPNPELERQITRYQDRFENAHPDMTDFEDSLHAHLALRRLESILDASLSGARLLGSPLRIVYFMDEFEGLLQAMPNYFFVALRSIRDRFKYSVMFVTFTRNSLSYLAGNRMAVLEPFIELFNDNQVYVGPYGDDDAWRMIEQLEERTVSKDDYALGLLIRATGGFAGLLRAGFMHAEKLGQLQAPDYAQAVQLAARRLVAEPNVQAEAETLLRGLNAEEIKAMYAVAEGKQDQNGSLLRELLNKSMLTQNPSGQGVRISPPVLAAYIRNHPQVPEPRPSTPPVTLPEG
ncbi:MAG TPA: hypothetical protein PKD09_16660 [Aggregatilinea sp.]|uniref:hypothetical protein n=1 Tax=Aggregatilinea sp. TaxID=2806333 RepID=UPI002B6291EC|nr:hypothetical protein [Aggregatilinea sp.]HML23288.1 hypothetical protein [Aggregatilinea sp.]